MIWSNSPPARLRRDLPRRHLGGLVLHGDDRACGLQIIPSSLYKAADVDGAGRVRKFFEIMLPLIDALKRSLNVQMTGLQWILNVYTLAYAVFLLSALRRARS